jgi:hypothetical protein
MSLRVFLKFYWSWRSDILEFWLGNFLSLEFVFWKRKILLHHIVRDFTIRDISDFFTKILYQWISIRDVANCKILNDEILLKTNYSRTPQVSNFGRKASAISKPFWVLLLINLFDQIKTTSLHRSPTKLSLKILP